MTPPIEQYLHNNAQSSLHKAIRSLLLPDDARAPRRKRIGIYKMRGVHPCPIRIYRPRESHVRPHLRPIGVEWTSSSKPQSRTVSLPRWWPKEEAIHTRQEKKNANANQNDIRSKAGFFHLLSMPEKVGSLIQRVGFSSPRSSNAFGRPGRCLRMLLMATWTLASIFGGSFAISSGLRWISVS